MALKLRYVDEKELPMLGSQQHEYVLDYRGPKSAWEIQTGKDMMNLTVRELKKFSISTFPWNRNKIF